MKPWSGFRCEDCGEFERSPVHISRFTSTAVNRESMSAAQIKRGTEASGTLHTTEVIQRGSRFSFEVLVHDDRQNAASQLKSICEKALPDEGIGGSKSRGLGRMAVEAFKAEAIDTVALEKRAKELDVRQYRVRLVSPMVLEGRLLEAKTLLEAARRAYTWCLHEGKPALPEVKLERWAVDEELLSGWSLKTDARRRIEPALSAGSVFEFTCGVESQELALGLAALEYYAVGDYKPHGCGQIVIEKPR